MLLMEKPTKIGIALHAIAELRELIWERGEILDEAITDFDRAIELSPGDATIYFARAEARTAILGFNEKAISDYTKAIELNPDYTLAYRNRGLALINPGFPEDATSALADLDKAIELDPNDPVSFYNRGRIYLWLQTEDDYNERALADFNKTLELDPEFVWAYWGRGLTFEYLENYEAAFADYLYYQEIDHPEVSREVVEEAIDRIESILSKE